MPDGPVVPPRRGAYGLVLAAGAGTRMGRPKALLVDPAGEPWVARAVRVLREGGCARVAVVLGAGADQARPLVPTGTAVVLAERWAEGLSVSLLAGLAAAADTDADRVVVHLVDLPDVTAAVVDRVLHTARPSPSALARAVFAGRPGHPVVLGRDHWAGVVAHVDGDRGAGGYLSAAGAIGVECGDLAGGGDVDRPVRPDQLGGTDL